jgi:hypothetical protein
MPAYVCLLFGLHGFLVSQSASVDTSAQDRYPLGLLHFKEISIYVFPEKQLCGLSSNFHIHVSVSDVYIPTIGPPLFLEQNMRIDGGSI